MLDVPFAKLMGGSAQQMLAREGGFGMHEGHDILQLVTETKGPPGLIKAGPAPKAAA